MTQTDALSTTEPMTASEAAAYLHLTRQTISRLIRSGQLIAHKKTLTPHSAYLVDRASVLEYDARRRAAPCGAA
jgi:excisionase family DNA binding protein